MEKGEQAMSKNDHILFHRSSPHLVVDVHGPAVAVGAQHGFPLHGLPGHAEGDVGVRVVAVNLGEGTSCFKGIYNRVDRFKDNFRIGYSQSNILMRITMLFPIM